MNSEGSRKELRLLKKGKKGMMRVVFSRFGIVLVLILLQLALLFSLFVWLRNKTPFYYLLSQIFTVCMAIWLFNSSIDPTGKITWLALIAVFPVGGAVLLLYTRRDLGHRIHMEHLKHLLELSRNKLSDNKDIYEELLAENPGAASLSAYLYSHGEFPICRCGELEYFPSGREFWHALLRELKKAKKFIFLEYFVIEEGLMWGEILKILVDQVEKGVDVRVIYDGTCEFSLLPHKYPEMLEKLGIRCRVFARLTPFISTYYNYRDHRKIAVIDGHTAFTGSSNLADEYIGETIRFGEWKDADIMFRGEAARTFTRTFLEMWYEDVNEVDFDRFLNTGEDTPCGAPEEAKSPRGYILPYADNPLDDNKVAEMVYIDILSRSTSYTYIMTPYLILDGEMETALKFAAERGVDVKLILPGIPDKRVPYALAWTHYKSLLDGGVEIYHFTPGFLHSKVFLSDDREAVAGTVNLDYRSLYHHFECAAYMYGTADLFAVKKDFLDTLSRSERVTYDTIKKTKLSMKLAGTIIKTVAPLL